MESPISEFVGALVLVTNGAQPIQLQIIKQLLERGCRVRTTSGSTESGYWLDNQFCMAKHSGRFEHVKLVLGENPADTSLYKEVLQGVEAIVHSPTIIDLGKPVKKVWAMAADSVLGMLEAAKAEESVNAFVYTSSIQAVTSLLAGGDQRLITENSWNARDAILAMSGQKEPHLVHSSTVAYAEQALWQWASTRAPNFKVNSICPSSLIGQNFAPERTSDWKNWIFELYQNGHAQEVIPGAGPTQARKSSSYPRPPSSRLVTLAGSLLTWAGRLVRRRRRRGAAARRGHLRQGYHGRPSPSVGLLPGLERRHRGAAGSRARLPGCDAALLHRPRRSEALPVVHAARPRGGDLEEVEEGRRLEILRGDDCRERRDVPAHGLPHGRNQVLDGARSGRRLCLSWYIS
jgi:hypothetical protein